MIILLFFFASGGLIIASWLVVLLGMHFSSGGTLPSQIIGGLRAIGLFYPTIFYVEAFELFVWMFKCIEDNGIYYMELTSNLDGKLLCWDTIHIVYISLAAIFLILHITFAFLFVNMDLEMKMNTKNHTARSVNILDALGIVQASSIVLTIAIFGYGSQQIIGLVLFGLSALKLVLTLMIEPYHKRNVQQFTLILNSIEMWVNTCLFLELFFSWMDFSINILLAILGAPLFSLIVLYVWYERNTALLRLKTKKSSTYNMYLKIRKLIDIYDNPDELENAMWLNGLLSRHVKKCKHETCTFCEEFKIILETKNNIPEDCTRAYYNFINNKYKKVVRAEPYNTFLRISYALFLSEYLKNRVTALIQLEAAQNLHPGFSAELLLWRYKALFESELAEEKLKINKMTQSNIELAIKFDILCTKLHEALRDSATAFSEIWTYMKNENPSTAQLERLTNKIFEYGTIVENTWEEIVMIKGDVPKTLHIYAEYQLKVANDPKTSNSLLIKARNEEKIQNQAHQESELTLKDMRNISDYSSDGTPCIYISALPVNFLFK